VPTQIVKPIQGKPVVPVDPDKIAHRQVKLSEELSNLNISPSVKTIMGLDGNAGDRNARINALKRLTRQLKDDDVKALCLFLDYKYEDHKELPLLTLNALKNDALDIMLRQDKRVDGLGGQLVAMYKDKEHDDVWRDYCVQYFGIYYNHKWPGTRQDAGAVVQNNEDIERKNIEDAYWVAMQEKDKSTAGTSLLNLESLSRTHPEFDRKKIADRALELAADNGCIEPSRITALRICGIMNKAEALPVARDIAQTGETVMLRMAAIATIGDLGGKDDVELVQSLVNNPEKRIKTIAETALKKVKARAGIKEQGGV